MYGRKRNPASTHPLCVVPLSPPQPTSPPSVSLSFWQPTTRQHKHFSRCACVCVCVRPLTPQLSTQHCCLSMRTCVTVCMCANASASHGDQQWELKGQSQHSNTHQTRGTIAFCSHVNACATPFMCKKPLNLPVKDS